MRNLKVPFAAAVVVEIAPVASSSTSTAPETSSEGCPVVVVVERSSPLLWLLEVAEANGQHLILSLLVVLLAVESGSIRATSAPVATETPRRLHLENGRSLKT